MFQISHKRSLHRGAPKIAFSWLISPITMVHTWYIYTFYGVYKATCNWGPGGAPHCKTYGLAIFELERNSWLWIWGLQDRNEGSINNNCDSIWSCLMAGKSFMFFFQVFFISRGHQPWPAGNSPIDRSFSHWNANSPCELPLTGIFSLPCLSAGGYRISQDSLNGLLGCFPIALSLGIAGSWNGATQKYNISLVIFCGDVPLHRPEK